MRDSYKMFKYMKNMMFTLKAVLFVLVLVKESLQSECGKRLENGAVICVLKTDNMQVNSFEFSLCTHGVVIPDFTCKNETCSFMWSKESQSLSKWAHPHFPRKLGVLFPAGEPLYNYLSTPERRENTAKNMTDWMVDNGMTFVKFTGISIHLGSNETAISHFNNFVEELAKKLHEHDFHIGLDFTLKGNGLLIKYDLKRLSRVVDWFHVSATVTEFNGYMQPFTPLTSFNGVASVAGSTKYWIEKFLQLLKAECLVLNVGPAMQQQSAIESAVDPGPGSKAKLITIPQSTKISDICYLLLVEDTCREFWDEESSTPWVVCGNDFYTYDNARSLQLKIALAKQFNITRLVFWASDISADNICADGDPLILLRAVQGIRQKNL